MSEVAFDAADLKKVFGLSLSDAEHAVGLMAAQGSKALDDLEELIPLETVELMLNEEDQTPDAIAFEPEGTVLKHRNQIETLIYDFAADEWILSTIDEWYDEAQDAEPDQDDDDE